MNTSDIGDHGLLLCYFFSWSLIFQLAGSSWVVFCTPHTHPRLFFPHPVHLLVDTRKLPGLAVLNLVTQCPVLQWLDCYGARASQGACGQLSPDAASDSFQHCYSQGMAMTASSGSFPSLERLTRPLVVCRKASSGPQLFIGHSCPGDPTGIRFSPSCLLLCSKPWRPLAQDTPSALQLCFCPISMFGSFFSIAILLNL